MRAATLSLSISLFAFLLLAAGCQESGQGELAVSLPATCFEPEPRVIEASPQPARRPVVAEVPPPAGRSVQGRPLQCFVAGDGGETVLILGGIHGNEPAGVPLCEQLYLYLRAHPDQRSGRRVVIAPALNPDGLAMDRRANAHGVDLNRNFRTANRRNCARFGLQPLSEPESRYVARLIDRYRPCRIVTIHQPLACVDWDGPGEGLAAAMARACGLPHKRLGARPGSLGSFAGEDRHIPTVTLELPRDATDDTPAQLWQRYGRALLVAIGHPAAAADLAK